MSNLLQDVGVHHQPGCVIPRPPPCGGGPTIPLMRLQFFLTTVFTFSSKARSAQPEIDLLRSMHWIGSFVRGGTPN